jgi:hypothetical protein
LKVAEHVKIVRFTTGSVLAIATLLDHVRVPVKGRPRSIKLLTEVAFGILGLPVNDTSVLRLFKTQKGIPWLLGRNVIRMDPDHWNSSPHVVDAATDVVRFEKVDNLPNFFSTLSQVVLKPFHYELESLGWSVPSAYRSLSGLLDFFLEPPLPYPRQLDTLDSIIAALKPFAPLPHYWLTFFIAVVLDESHLSEVKSMFEFDPEKDAVHYLVPLLFPLPKGWLTITSGDGEIDQDTADFFGTKWPSFTRRFMRLRDCPIVTGKTRDYADSIARVLTPVPAPLCYAGAAFQGVRADPASTPLTLLRYGLYSAGIGQALMTEVRVQSLEAIVASFNIWRLEKEHLALAMPWTTPALAKDAVISALIDSAVAEGASITFSKRVIDSVLFICPLEQVVTILCNKQFLTKPNFPSVIVIFKTFKAALARQGATNLFDFCKILQDPETGIFETEAKKKIFQDLSNPANIALALHHIPTE